MKFLFVILALLLAPKECDQKKSVAETDKIEIVKNEETTRQQQKDYIIEYTAITRGSYKGIVINSNTITVKNGRDLEPVTKPCSKEIWEDIMQKLDSINLKALTNLVAPTQKRLYDGAAHANIKITIGDKTYETQGFDHGFPPEEIKILCDKVLEISDDKKE